MNAQEIAAKAADLVGGDRAQTHGDKRALNEMVASLWSVYLGIDGRIGAADVAMMMALLKVARTKFGSLNLDDYVDLAGYAACAGEIAQQHPPKVS